VSIKCPAATSLARTRRPAALIAMCLLCPGGVHSETLTNVRFAQNAHDQKQETEARNAARQARRIEGVWDVMVTISDCQTGTPLTTVRARNMFIRGGTLTELNARGNPTRRDPSFGTWHIEESGTYFAVFRYSRFNPDGTFSQTVKVTRRIRLTPDANHFTADAAVEVFDVNDTLIETGCATEKASRLP
jgi:hypothetical protein